MGCSTQLNSNKYIRRPCLALAKAGRRPGPPWVWELCLCSKPCFLAGPPWRLCLPSRLSLHLLAFPLFRNCWMAFPSARLCQNLHNSPCSLLKDGTRKTFPRSPGLPPDFFRVSKLLDGTFKPLARLLGLPDVKTCKTLPAACSKMVPSSPSLGLVAFPFPFCRVPKLLDGTFKTLPAASTGILTTPSKPSLQLPLASSQPSSCQASWAAFHWPGFRNCWMAPSKPFAQPGFLGCLPLARRPGLPDCVITCKTISAACPEMVPSRPSLGRLPPDFCKVSKLLDGTFQTTGQASWRRQSLQNSPCSLLQDGTL